MPRGRTLSRENFSPSDATLREDLDSDAVAWLWDYERNGATDFCFAGFVGRSSKPVMRYRYGSLESRNTAITKMFVSRRERNAAKRKRAAEKRNTPHTLEVGDILASSWGYDQTNVDFYQVVRLAGPTMVWLREIGQNKKETGFMTGTTTPVRNRFVGQAFRRRPWRDSVRIASFSSAIKVPRQADGTYPPIRWSSYA